MTARPTRTGVAAWLVVSSTVVAAVVLRLPGAAVVVLPLLFVLVHETVVARTTAPVLRSVRLPPRVVTGDRAPLTLELATDVAGDWRVAVDAGPHLALLEWEGGTILHTTPGITTTTVDLVARRWGLARVSTLHLTWTSPLRTRAATVSYPVEDGVVRVLPPRQILQPVRPRRTSGWAGLLVARNAARGTEFAELRPFAAGDRERDVHWPTTLRRGEAWVTARHPDRGGVVVLAVDLFDPVMLPDVVRATLQLVEAHHAARDRIGVVGLGGVVSWVAPGGGERHRAALVDQVIRSQFVPTWVTRSVDQLPPSAVPTDALVVAIASLADEMTTLVTQFRNRGHDVVVLDLERPEDAYEPDTADHVAARLLRLEQRRRRRSLARLGITVVGHDVRRPLAASLQLANGRRDLRGTVGSPG